MARDVEAVRRQILCPNSSSYDIRHMELTTFFTTGRSCAPLHSLGRKQRKGVAMPTATEEARHQKAPTTTHGATIFEKEARQ